MLLRFPLSSSDVRTLEIFSSPAADSGVYNDGDGVDDDDARFYSSCAFLSGGTNMLNFYILRLCGGIQRIVKITHLDTMCPLLALLLHRVALCVGIWMQRAENVNAAVVVDVVNYQLSTST